jgi:hypothetical protein
MLVRYISGGLRYKGGIYSPEPFVGRSDQTRKMSLHILDIVQFRRQRVVHINNQDLPVGFSFVEKCHDTEDFDLLDLTRIADLLSDLADIKRVVIAFGFSFRVNLGRIFPCLSRDTGKP